MTYHMANKAVQSNKSLRIDSQKLFPEKLYDVADDGYLFRWTDNGTWVSVVDEKLFENEVMRRYPGFLQIPSFQNLRRLFREYGFDWRVDDETSQYEFAHPCFRKGKPELLDNMRTRRQRSGSKVLYSVGKRKSEGRTTTPVMKRTRSSYRTTNRDATGKEIASIKEDDDDADSTPKMYRASMEALSPPMKGYGYVEFNSPQSDYDCTLSSSQRSNSASEEHGSGRVRNQKKDFSDLMSTLIRNEIENGASDQEDKFIPTEVWTQSGAPACPTAAFVGANFATDEDGSHSYRNMGQAQSPYNWQWGNPTHYPPYYPYNNGPENKPGEQAYSPPSHWAHGAGDTTSGSTNQSSRSQMTAPYWGYPPPWFYHPPQSYGNYWYPPQQGHYPPQDQQQLIDNSAQTPDSCSPMTQSTNTDSASNNDNLVTIVDSTVPTETVAVKLEIPSQ